MVYATKGLLATGRGDKYVASRCISGVRSLALSEKLNFTTLTQCSRGNSEICHHAKHIQQLEEQNRQLHSYGADENRSVHCQIGNCIWALSRSEERLRRLNESHQYLMISIRIKIANHHRRMCQRLELCDSGWTFMNDFKHWQNGTRHAVTPQEIFDVVQTYEPAVSTEQGFVERVLPITIELSRDDLPLLFLSPKLDAFLTAVPVNYKIRDISQRDRRLEELQTEAEELRAQNLGSKFGAR